MNRLMGGSSGDVYDAVIVGGGPAGASAAIHLATGGARVLLAERRRFPRPKLCGEFISPECLTHFARLGVMDGMIQAGGREVAETIFYVRSGNSVAIPSEWFQSGSNRAALGLSRAEMDARLLARARAAGVEVLEEAQASGLFVENERVRGVHLKVNGSERTYRSLVTIDATGRARALTRRIEITTTIGKQKSKRRAPLVAFKAHLENTSGDEGTCEIYFYQGGYGGLSAIENGLSNLCFIARARDVQARGGGDAARVMREVVMSNKRAAHALGKARVRSEWLCVALESFGRRELIRADGLIAVGDAASFIDPFTGSGMLMALESGELAAKVISRHLTSSRQEAFFTTLADEYRRAYNEQFGARLRVCAWLRRAAFAPQVAAEAAVMALGISAHARRYLARATRRASPSSQPR